MGIERVIERQGKFWKTAMENLVTVTILATMTGIGMMVYVGFNLNKENLTRSLVVDGQKVEYAARVPRTGLLSGIPWNDDDGHAIITVYGAKGNKAYIGFDQDYNGSLKDGLDSITILAGGNAMDGEKGINCFLKKAVDSDGNDVPFAKSGDQLRHAMAMAARDYCDSQFAFVDGIYQQVRKQFEARKRSGLI